MPATRAAGAALPVKLVLKDTSVPDSKTAGTQCQYASKYEVHQITSSWQSGSFPKTFKNTNQTNQITFFGLKLMEYIHLLKHPTDFNRLQQTGNPSPLKAARRCFTLSAALSATAVTTSLLGGLEVNENTLGARASCGTNPVLYPKAIWIHIMAFYGFFRSTLRDRQVYLFSVRKVLPRMPP